MTRPWIRWAMACGVLLSGVAGTAEAADAPVQVSEIVGREALEQRIANAVALVCSPRPAIVDLAQSHEYGKCRAHAITGARQQLAQLYSGRVLAQASIAVGPGKR